MLRRWLVVTCVAALSMSACGDDDGPSAADTGPRADTGLPPPPPPPGDGGGIDTGVPPVDMGPGVDMGPRPDTGPTPPPPPGMCPAGMCDLEAQTGCGAGQACDWGAPPGMPPTPYCRMAGTAGDGQPCNDMTLCQEGLICLGAAGSATCHAICCNDNDAACPAGQTCSIRVVSEGMPDSPVGACDAPDNCDVQAQTGCSAAEYCYPAGSDGSTVCASPGTAAAGAACTALNQCARGFICPGGASSVCRQVCNPSAMPTDCPMGSRCQPFEGFEMTLGACAAM